LVLLKNAMNHTCKVVTLRAAISVLSFNKRRLRAMGSKNSKLICPPEALIPPSTPDPLPPVLLFGDLLYPVDHSPQIFSVYFDARK